MPLTTTIWAIPILITVLFAAAPAARGSEAPVADAGPHRRAHLGDTVQFDGSGSYDPGGGTLTNYAWFVQSAPPGSTAAFSDQFAVDPTFTPDMVGDYVIYLIVSADYGVNWSDPDTIGLKVGVLYALGEEPDIQISETRLTNDPATQFDAAVSGANTVYTDLQEGTQDIYRVVLDGDPGPLVHGTGNQSQPDIDGTTVVYTDDNEGSQDVWWYDWLTAEHFKITANPFDDVTPVISGNDVVYDGYSGSSNDIYWYSYDTGFITALSTDPPPESNPAIDNNLVAWMVFSFDTFTFDVQATELGGSVFTAAGSMSDEFNPRVSGNLITYILDFDVGYYDHASGQTVRLTQDAHVQNMAVPSGNYIYFTDNRTGSDQLYVHLVDSGVTYQLTDSAVALGLDDADGQTVVYNDQRYGNVEVFRLTWGFDQPPIADAGPDQTVFVDELVQLSASGSYDPDGQGITGYQWAFESKPSGSTAELNDPNYDTPSFTPDIAGLYVLSLIVQAGGVWSDPDYVTVTAESTNLPPVADAGPDQPDAIVGSLVTLDGTGSWDPDGDDIVEYVWAFLGNPPGVPPGSLATLDDPNSATPSFTPDVEGLYIIVLLVFDGCEWSTPDIVQVYAVRPGDLDGDGDIDWDDYDLFADCLGGPEDPPTGDCGPAADMDGDGDVDLEDFAEFQRIFEG